MLNLRSACHVMIVTCVLGISSWASKSQPATTAAYCELGALSGPPTDLAKTFIRKGFGEWHAPRQAGPHKGADIIVNASYPDNPPYAVYPIASGVVAYSRVNGTQTTGYGNTIVVDHGNNCYSLYAHLANSPFTPMQPGGNLLRAVGDRVSRTDRLGYFVDIRADVDSSGNAQNTAAEARHQVHFALIQAPSGRTSTGALKDIIGTDSAYRDPTPYLVSKGYQIR